MTIQHFEKHIDIDQDGLKAVDLLAAKTGLSKQRVKRVMSRGAVWLSTGDYTQRLRRSSKTLSAGSILHIYYDEKIIDSKPLDARLIADEGAYSVWDKPSGMYSQGTKWGDHCAIYRWAEAQLQPQRPAFLVHRLDRAASGLILIAHTKQAARDFSAMFKARKIVKHYCVRLSGQFPAEPNPRILDEPIDGRDARSSFAFQRYDPYLDESVLEANIETGRKHQIRRHLASLGFPVIGDRLYGGADESRDLQLRASSLAFCCPMSGVDKEYTVEAVTGEIPHS